MPFWTTETPLLNFESILLGGFCINQKKVQEYITSLSRILDSRQVLRYPGSRYPFLKISRIKWTASHVWESFRNDFLLVRCASFFRCVIVFSSIKEKGKTALSPRVVQRFTTNKQLVRLLGEGGVGVLSSRFLALFLSSFQWRACLQARVIKTNSQDRTNLVRVDHFRNISNENRLVYNFVEDNMTRFIHVSNFLQGHVVLTDFGLCKEGIEPSGTTSTFCGTPEVG